MRYGLLFIVVVCSALVYPAVLLGQAAPAPSLPAQTRWVDFSLELGRVVARCTKFGQNVSAAAGNEETGDQESFDISFQGKSAIVRYESHTRCERLVVEFMAEQQLTLRREPLGNHPALPLAYRQAATGPVTLVLGDASNPRVLTADSLWHLWLRYPDECRRELHPVLLRLRTDWDPAAAADQIVAGLLASAHADDAPERTHWVQLVNRLNAPSFVERQAAERDLKAAGMAVLPYLQTLDSRRLAREQQERVHRIVAGLAAAAPDSPERVCAYLRSDYRAWLALLASNKLEHRAAARHRLEQLLGRSFEFDPHAPEAQRQRQFAAVEKLATAR